MKQDIKLQYALDDSPPLWELILYGLQWLAISIPTIIIIGRVVAGIETTEPLAQVAYIQKAFFVTGIVLLVQILWGHRLPLILGPAAVLLVSIAASSGSNVDSIYTAIAIGGAVLALTGITGIFGRLLGIFTPRVVASILLLIALTLTPTIMGLVTASNAGVAAQANLIFSLVFVLVLFIAARYLKGIWKATLIVWAIIAGTLVYKLFFPAYAGTMSFDSAAVGYQFLFSGISLSVDWGVILAFLISFLALSINDLGSIQSVGEMIKPDGMEKRISRGTFVTGLGNILSGLMGVIGPVDFSMSPGVIATSRCASRFTLIPTGIGLLVLSFLPAVISFAGTIPSAVIGSVLVYIMCSQISAGLIMAYGSGDFSFDNGLTVGLPLMLGVIISFLPGAVTAGFPPTLRPILGNGFVVGVVAVLVMEHLIIKGRP
ncbi:purine/pyrimidine permease [Metallumcola ferriviriculae]|uniref:Purine/pyrimidine permease n=1 Tax=Metallumcola ferriviriculae TaxID=3039180 RepID=A0AAU0UT84_9FIRM|nr:purine/pyrimidine permease [Desulfitibacteraceae bacterium MK1]